MEANRDFHCGRGERHRGQHIPLRPTRDLDATTVPGLLDPLQEQFKAEMYDDLSHR